MPDFGRWAAGGGDPSLNEINRADRFIDALSSTQPVYSTDPAEAQLASLLSDWRDEVRDAPITAPVTARDAVAALDGGRSARRSRGSLALVGSVAAAMLCVGGFGAAVYGSGPGDALYGMRSSLFGTEQATRDDQVSLASAQLQQVQQLIDQGQWQQAQDKLVQVSSAVQNVDATESKQDLVEQWNALTYKVVEQNPAATLPPGEPLPPLPSSPLTWLPVPVVEATTTSEATVTSETATTSGSSVTTQSSNQTEPSNSTDSSVPPEVVLTPPLESSTGPSTPSPTSIAPPVGTPPSSATTTTVTSAAATTTTRPVPPPPVNVVAPVAPPPQVAPSTPKPPPASEPVASAPPAVPSQPVVSSQPKAPATTSTPQEVQGGGAIQGGADDRVVVTTTTVPPR